MRLIILLITTLAAAATHTPACPSEENCHCTVPGVTIRWKAAYCMALNQTDDLENEAVSACIAAPDPAVIRGRPACEQNLRWKTEVCRATNNGDRRKASACVRNRTMIPAIVRRGAGS